jgi:hypothetical protein
MVKETHTTAMMKPASPRRAVLVSAGRCQMGIPLSFDTSWRKIACVRSIVDTHQKL